MGSLYPDNWLARTLLTMGLLFFFLLYGNYQNTVQLLVGGLFILCSVISIGGLLEHEKWVFPLEMLRLFLLLLFIAITFFSGTACPLSNHHNSVALL